MQLKILSEIALAAMVLIACSSGLAGGLSLDYSTYLGGTSYEGHWYAAMGGIAVDSDGCAYVSGITASTDFPTLNPYQSRSSLYSDIFIVKTSSTGSDMIFSTYLGGSREDYDFSLIISLDKCPYVTGATASTDFPTINSYQPSYGGQVDAIVAKLSSSGSDLRYSTYLGGSDQEVGYDIALGFDESIHVIGDVYSSDFPTINAYQASFGGGDIWGGDAFVTGISPTGSSLVYSSYLGGSDWDAGRAVEIASDSSISTVGVTFSYDYPTLNAYQNYLSGTCDAFVSKLLPSGSNITFSTYFGGQDGDGAWDVVSLNKTLIVTGGTFSIDFPTLNAYQSSYSGIISPNLGDAFLTCIEPDSARVIFSTYLGGNGTEFGNGINASSNGEIYIIGWTSSENFPTAYAYQSSIAPGTEDAFASKISSSGSYLIYSTYLGGSGNDRGENLDIDSLGCVYMSGDTESVDFPTINAYQATYAGAIDAFVSKFRWEPSPTPTPISQIVTLDSGDYNGDGTSEIAIFRPSTGSWRLSNLGSTSFGKDGDIPISGDYWGDGTSEIGVFRPSTGSWLVRSLTRFAFGAAVNIPVPRDYDRDGDTDAAVFRPDEGLWSIRDLTDINFGKAGDVPLPADYDGDGWIEAAIFRPSSGLWAIRSLTQKWFGTAGDVPVPADYDLDGTTEIAVYRPSSGLWAGILTGDAQTRIRLGLEGDIPVPANFDGGDWTQPAVFRSSSGLWAIRNLTRVYFGATGDIPVTR